MNNNWRIILKYILLTVNSNMQMRDSYNAITILYYYIFMGKEIDCVSFDDKVSVMNSFIVNKYLNADKRKVAELYVWQQLFLLIFFLLFGKF